MLTYTTKEAIANRLRGRLVVGGTQVPFAPTTVDDNLIEQVATQVEALVDAKLKTVFRMPLTGTHAVLSSIVEKLVICEIMPTHEQQNGGYGSQPKSFREIICAQGAAELEEVLSGMVPLDGEALASTGTTPISTNLTLAAKRTPGAAEAVQW
jgi:phage gp36-like protein